MCCISLDFWKEFDIIDHEILFTKLKAYNIIGETYNLFQSYLSSRKQSTFFKETYSTYEEISSGVPQGSILGPILFSIFINDLPFSPTSKVDMYADDATISIVADNLLDLGNKANETVSNIYDWCLRNSMVLNESKTKYLLITNYQRRSFLNNPSLKINIGETLIEQTSEEKLLGII